MAVWSSATDNSSLAKHVMVLVFAGYFLSPCLGAPVREETWNEPCGQFSRITRHIHNSKDIQKVKQAFDILEKSFKFDFDKNMQELYGIQNNKMAHVPIAKNSWLKLKQMLKHIGNLKSKKNVMEFYKALQRFAATAYVFGEMNINTNSQKFKHTKRKVLYKMIVSRINLVLCETSDVLHGKYNVQTPTLKVEDMKAPLEKLRTADLTNAQVFDYNYLKKLSTFIKRMRKVLKARKRVKKTSDKNIVLKRTSKKIKSSTS